MNNINDGNQESLLFSLEDFKRICKKWRNPILKGAIAGALLATSFTLLRPLKFFSEATFYEKTKSNGDTKNAALLLLGEEKENSAVVMLKSQKILEAAIKKLDLQASIEPYSLWPKSIRKIFKHLDYAKDHFISQVAHLKGSEYPSIEEPSFKLTAKAVSYSQEIPLYLHLHFISSDTYNVIDSEGNELGEGKLNIPFKIGKTAFTLASNSSDCLNAQNFELTLTPLGKLALELADNLKVSSDYTDKSFITLTLNYRTRFGTSALLNSIMEAYCDHLRTEHHRVVASQVAYLKERRQIMEEEISKLMHEHAEQLTAQAGNLELLIATQQNLQKRLLSIDLESKHMQKVLDEGSYLQVQCCTDKDPPFVHQMAKEILLQRQQCDSIELALGDRLSHLKNAKQEFQGINLKTANTLYVAYSNELHTAEAELSQKHFILDKIQRPDFELSSLSAVLIDPVSLEIVKKASQLVLSIKDQQNRSERELERLQQDLEVQRNFLVLHLQQMVELLKLSIAHLQSKIEALQGVTFELLQQKISLQEKHLLDYTSSRLNSLKMEYALISQQKQVLQNEFDRLPEQWAAEKLVDLALKTEGSIMQHIGSLIESKNIADHLEMSLSAPFDFAVSPLHPRSPHLLLYALLGALLGGLGVTCYALLKSIKEGVDATKDNLLRAGQQVAGEISNKFHPESNLEGIRRLASQLCSAQNKRSSVLLLEGNGLDYASQLATLLSKRQLKVLIMYISFDQCLQEDKEKPNSLLSYLEGHSKEVEIVKAEHFDLIPAEGFSCYGSELIESPLFQELLIHLTQKYDWILAVSKAPLLSAEVETILPLFDCAAFSVTHEKLHDLQRFFNLGKRSSFVIVT